MNKAQDFLVMTVKAPPDVRTKLQQWASSNLTSMTAEFVRSVRERAERERRQLEKVTD
jgi:predicted transcriptional regulator